MRLPDDFRGCEAIPVAGGDINDAARVRLPDGEIVFLKFNERAPDGMFEAEARGLGLLASVVPDAVPTVLACTEQWLQLGWIEPGTHVARAEQRLAAIVATLHQQHTDRFGLDHPNFIGTLPQPNDWCDAFPEFHWTQRIEPQLRRARDTGLYDTSTVAMFERGMDALHALVPHEPPTLVHGDLWAGNVVWGSGERPWLVDPAVAYSHRELELAFMRLFGAFGDAFWSGYAELLPIADGFEERCPALQCYPLLVHANLFGGSYVGRAREAAAALL